MRQKKIKSEPIELAKILQSAGSGELIFNFVDRDGSMIGYDLDYAEMLKKELSIPVNILAAGS